MTDRFQSISGSEDLARVPQLVEESTAAPQRQQSFRRASWARGLSLTPTEYARVAAFQRTAANADKARLALTEPESGKRRLKLTKAKPFPLDEDQVRRMEDMALDLYRELREDARLQKAADRALMPLRRVRQQRAEEQAAQQKQETEGLNQLWDIA